MRKLFVYFLWTLLTVFVLGTAGAFYAIDQGWIGYMPPIEDLQNPINRFATQIYSADGKIIGTWNYNRENRVMVDYTQLPQSLVQALVATEDIRFYDHSGIDFYALGRAIMWRFYHHAAARKTALFRARKYDVGACASKTDRVGHSSETGT